MVCRTVEERYICTYVHIIIIIIIIIYEGAIITIDCTSYVAGKATYFFKFSELQPFIKINLQKYDNVVVVVYMTCSSTLKTT